MNNPLVSMITYCYNGERFVTKYFEALLKQTYNNVELIFFNNGSEDKTGEIAESYKKRLEEKGYAVRVIHYETNQLTTSLKQKGLQEAQGEYIFGCDSDDLLYPTYIEEMSGYLRANPERGLVFCQLDVVNEDTGRKITLMRMSPQKRAGEAFENILLAKNTTYTAISYMLSRKWLEIVNPEKTIHQTRSGENYQMLMPFLYRDLHGYIEKPLGQYTVRSDSYSAKLNADKLVTALKLQEETVLATLISIQPKKIDYYRNMAMKRIRRDRFYASLLLKNKDLVMTCYRELFEVGGCKTKEKLFLAGYQFKPLGYLLRTIASVKKCINNCKSK